MLGKLYKRACPMQVPFLRAINQKERNSGFSRSIWSFVELVLHIFDYNSDATYD